MLAMLLKMPYTLETQLTDIFSNKTAPCSKNYLKASLINTATDRKFKN